MAEYKDSVDSLIEAVRKVAGSVKQKDLDALVDAILSGNRIFIYGSGRSGLVGQYFSVRLVQLGCEGVHFVGDMTTPIIGKDDVVILISNTGETMSAVQTANIARRMGANVISITASKVSKLAHASNSVVILNTSAVQDSGPMPLATLFEDAVIIMFDGIIPILMERMNVTEEDMRKRHAIWV
ncbi:MAG: SIS domain-containing protein [Candidatus Methanomethylophilaceae archaeon]|nr:SIS domain-containing protein [Candidatus Methanomethylophilaceae archaeon]